VHRTYRKRENDVAEIPLRARHCGGGLLDPLVLLGEVSFFAFHLDGSLSVSGSDGTSRTGGASRG